MVGGQGPQGREEGGGREGERAGSGERHEDAADVDVDVDGGEAGGTGLQALNGFPDVGAQDVICRDERQRAVEEEGRERKGGREGG